MFPNYFDGATILTIAHLADDSENEFVKKIFAMINQQPRRKRRGTVLNVSHCVFYKVVAVGFNTLCYDASVGVLNPPHE
ncbi:hypothetical protein [Treponema medium]|uniref:hypothetical protein n=1 Tax=Treponema medium TaxID=58231 RepID=UPI00197F817F|nr:hypothetical protein [Treponema medium]